MTTTQSFNVRAHLIPFVTRVLYRGDKERHQPQEWPVPVGLHDTYTQHDIEAWQDIFPQGVLYAFAHHAGGWQRQDTLAGREAWSSESRKQRMWDAASGVRLNFGEASLALCEGLYNAAARKPREASKRDKHKKHSDKEEIARLMNLKLDSSGDLALTYWMVCGLWPQLKALDALAKPVKSQRKSKNRGSPGWEGLLAHFASTNPLLGLRYGPFTGKPVPDDLGETLEALLASPQRALLPWWIEHAIGHWQDVEASLWSLGAEEFIRVRQHQSTLLCRWVEAIDNSGWVHLIAPLRGFFTRQERWIGALTGEQNPMSVPSNAWRRVPAARIPAPDVLVQGGISRLERAFKTLRHQERQDIRRAWAGLIESVMLLAECYRRRVRIHHADREANDVFLVTWGSEMQIEALAGRLREVARGIEGRLG